MYLKLLNLSGAALVLPGVGSFQSHASPQYVQDIDASDYTSSRCGGVNAAEVLRAAKAAGTIDYQLVLEAFDAGKVDVKSLRVSYARGHLDGASPQTFTDNEALPVGAMLLQAHLNVRELVAGGAISAAVVASGYTGSTSAFNASENVFTGATLSRRQLTTLAVGSDISGKVLTLVITATDADVSAATAGDLELSVLYAVVPAL